MVFSKLTDLQTCLLRLRQLLWRRLKKYPFGKLSIFLTFKLVAVFSSLEGISSFGTVSGRSLSLKLNLKRCYFIFHYKKEMRFPYCTKMIKFRNFVLFSLFQVYTGRYRTPREREAPIEMVDDFLSTLQVGCFVAIYFANYDKLPCIGNLIAIEENHFQVHYWKGTYSGKWCPPTSSSAKHEFNPQFVLVRPASDWYCNKQSKTWRLGRRSNRYYHMYLQCVQKNNQQFLATQLCPPPPPPVTHQQK